MGSAKSRLRPSSAVISYQDVPQALAGSGTFQDPVSEPFVAGLNNRGVRRRSRVVPVATGVGRPSGIPVPSGPSPLLDSWPETSACETSRDLAVRGGF